MGSVHLTDFGLAKSVATGSKFTRTGQALGTPAYMSPEQARGESDLSPATDVWSLGCILYELLAGRRAFEGETPAEVIAGVLTREPAPLERLRADVPGTLSTLLRVTLSKDPARRHGSARALRDDLERVLSGRRVIAGRRGGRRIGLAAAGTALVAGALGWTLGKRAMPGPPPPVGAPSAEALAAKAWSVRGTDRGRAIAGLCAALASDPSLHTRALQLGVLRWADGDNAVAAETWGRIPPESSAYAEARLYLGLEQLFLVRGTREGMEAARPHLARAAQAPGRTGQLARAALATAEGRGPDAVEALAGLTGWEAALLRGLVLGGATDLRGVRPVEQAYEEALAEGIPFFWVRVNLARIRLAMGETASVRRDVEGICTERPALGVGWYLRGLLRRAEGDLAGAAADLSEALRREPGFAKARFERSQVRSLAGDPSGELEDLDALLALPQAPDRKTQAAIHYNRGVALRTLGRTGEAADALERAVAADPGDGPAAYNAAVLRLELGSPDRALGLLDLAAIAQPDDLDIRLLRGQTRARAGDHDGALVDFTEAVRIAPGHPEGLWRLGAMRLTLGDPAGAERALAAAVAADPQLHAPIWAALGIARHALGDWAGAVTALRTYEVRVEPGRRNAEATAALADAEARLRANRGG